MRLITREYGINLMVLVLTDADSVESISIKQ